MEVNQKELGSILGITDRRVRQLQEQFGLFDKGIVEGEKSKRYRLEYCVQEYIKYKLEAEVTGGANVDREKEQAEHERIKKQISILKLRKLRRELHEADDVADFLTEMLINFRASLLSLPQKIGPLIIGEDINTVEEILKKEVYSALEELSEYDPMKIEKQNSHSIVAECLEDEEEDENKFVEDEE